MPIEAPDLLDVPAGASLLNLKPSTIRAWILQKRLPYVKLGRRVFLRRCDLLDLVSNSLVPAKA
jgi:excisionase family DNA binding protein